MAELSAAGLGAAGGRAIIVAARKWQRKILPFIGPVAIVGGALESLSLCLPADDPGTRTARRRAKILDTEIKMRKRG